LEALRNVTPAERLETTVLHIRQHAARVLALEGANLPDPRRALNELGFDSLTAVELCNRLGRSIGQHLNPALLYDYPTLESLAGHVLQDLLHLEFGDAVSTSATGSVGEEPTLDAVRVQAVAEVEAMSEADMDTLVAEQLSRLQSSAIVGDPVGNLPKT
jgi:acyl carrier protein